MRKVLAISAFLFLFASSTSAGEPDTVFQRAADVINGKYEMEVTPLKEVKFFQSMANAIGSVKKPR